MILVFTSDHPGIDPVLAATYAFGAQAVEQELVVVVHDSDAEPGDGQAHAPSAMLGVPPSTGLKA